MDRKRNARRRQLSGAYTAEQWNATHRIGTAVRYWPVYPPVAGVPPLDTTTRSEAWTLGDGTVVVAIVGKSGGVRLSHIEALSPPPSRSDDVEDDIADGMRRAERGEPS